MAWGMAANFVELYMRRARPVRSSRAWNASSRAEPSRSKKLTSTRSGSPESLTALRSPELRTQPMVPLSTTVSRQRSERRIAVRLPLKVRGCDARGFAFEEDTSSENLCRSGAAFLTHFDVAIGSDLEIRIPFSQYASRRAQPERFGGPANGNRFVGARINESDFATQGRVVHVCDSQSSGEKLVGVQFTGPRFQRVFRSESAA